ncbi:lactation elevated protein 1 [Echria macrotheca]|uniref:Lactation elevated protein 1 n=1 Tax=Echria macrotheca TaxID=438768 RepID=A0AAJ0F162_9PEZI|nr:lactation elevated protein 1 [Echria macrotheca]
MPRAATAVTITDPLVKYHSLIATRVCCPDAAQYRLAHHLQKLYLRLKDYTPSHEYRTRLGRIAQVVEKRRDDDENALASASHPIRRNPLFARFFQKPEDKDSLALMRVLTSHQAALNVDSPKGLFLSGEVGTGKSMLLDLLAEGMPTDRKRRWHFNTFMLYAMSRIEQYRKSHLQTPGLEDEYSLLWVAKELVEKSPILFLDEFQLPDRTASKIMSNLFIAFFQLGGVLIASSNRMPEELEKATGGYYSPPATGGLLEQVLGLRKKQSGGELFGQSSDFASFLDVLRARCEFWHMEGSRDWRRRETGVKSQGTRVGLSQEPTEVPSQTPTLKPSSEMDKNESGDCRYPAMYCLGSDGEQIWESAFSGASGVSVAAAAKWEPSSLVVYGRSVPVPRQYQGVSYWTFDQLVRSFGPADFLTLASTYHTFIIDQVPVLTLAMKNEARRFITLLDALYESRCKLVIRAAAVPDDLFFPDIRKPATCPEAAVPGQAEAEDATYSETIAEVFQDQISPFRPNISSYSGSRNARYDPDQDSDFKVEPDRMVDFGKASAFTGEDERFAYKRATSRLWELCTPELLDNLSLDERQCNAAFPGLTQDIDDVVAQGPFPVRNTGERGPVQGRIKNGQLYIINAQRRVDLSHEMLNSRTAALHQLHRAIVTSPTPLPDTIFSLNFQDQPFGTSWGYSRGASAALRSKDPTARNFLMPHFSFWAWKLPFVGSMARAARAIADVERIYHGTDGWQRKIPKAVWRGTSWFNSVHSPRLRHDLVNAARGKPWADVETLQWMGGGGANKNASNALRIEDFCRYKYVVHTEGITYSGRFQFLQMCASVVITPPIQWLQHTTHLVRPLFSGTLDLETTRSARERNAKKDGKPGSKAGASSGSRSGKWVPSEQVRTAWPVQYAPEEANIVFVARDWSDLEDTVSWLEEHPAVAEGIARRQRELFVGGGYFSQAAEACYWRALVRGWAKVAETDGQGWEDEEGMTFEAFVLGLDMES